MPADDLELHRLTSNRGPVEGSTYGLGRVGELEVAGVRAVALAGFVFDDGWSRVSGAVPVDTLPKTTARGHYVATVDDGEITDVDGRSFAWWPHHPDEDLPAAVPTGSATLEFDAWTRYDRDRYGAARMDATLDERDIAFTVYVPRYELPEVDADEYEGVVVGNELAGIEVAD